MISSNFPGRYAVKLFWAWHPFIAYSSSKTISYTRKIRRARHEKPTRHSRQLRAVIPASQKWNVLVFTRNKSDLHGGQTQRQIHRPTAQRCSKLYPSTGNNYPGRVIKTTQLLQKTIFNVSLMRRRKFRDGNERIH